MTTSTNPTIFAAQTIAIARKQARTHKTCPVEIVKGNAAPKLEGEPAYYTTPNGETVIRHPNAYRWPKIRHCSTQHVVVGEGWLRRLEKSGVRRETVDSADTWIRCHSRKTIDGCHVSAAWTDSGPCYLVTRGERSYHAGVSTAAEAVADALAMWTKADRAACEWTELLPVPVEQVQVTREDARAAGCCMAGVDAYIARHGLTEDAPVPAVALLALPDPEIHRVRATIAAAAQRMAS